MKQLLYVHARVQPIIVALSQLVMGWLGRRLTPAIRRLVPGPAGRRAALVLMWILGLLLQAVMVWLLKEIVELCIGLYELWAILARKYVELS